MKVKKTKEEWKVIKNKVYFLLSLIGAAALGFGACISMQIQLFTPQFYLFIAFSVSFCFTGYRTANLSKEFTISEYLWNKEPLQLDLVAYETIGIAVIKRSRQEKEEQVYQEEIKKKMESIKKEYEKKVD